MDLRTLLDCQESNHRINIQGSENLNEYNANYEDSYFLNNIRRRERDLHYTYFKAQFRMQRFYDVE
jgi:hypothetical protein